MGYKGVVKDNVIVLEQGVKLPEGTEVEVATSQGIPPRPQIAQGWWLSEEARRNATDKKASKKWLAKCDRHRERVKETTDSVQIIRELRDERTSR